MVVTFISYPHFRRVHLYVTTTPSFPDLEFKHCVEETLNITKRPWEGLESVYQWVYTGCWRHFIAFIYFEVGYINDISMRRHTIQILWWRFIGYSYLGLDFFLFQNEHDSTRPWMLTENKQTPSKNIYQVAVNTNTVPLHRLIPYHYTD